MTHNGRAIGERVTDSLPEFTVVTPTLNRLSWLKDAVESVRRQDYPHVEHLIVDGGSTDDTRDWVEAQADLTFMPPPDRGVYDAMNKGIAAASGDVIGLLNSDDLYPDGVFAAVANVLRERPDADIVAGHSRLDEGPRKIATYDQPCDLVPNARTVLIGRCLPNPRFFRREALRRLGPIDITHGLVADRDLLMRALEMGLRTVPLDRLVYIYRRHDGSLTFDAGLKLSLRLRRELLGLGQRWRNDPQAGAAARAAGCELEGRQRLMLAMLALKAGKLGDATARLMRDGDAYSTRPSRAVAYAAFAALKPTRGKS